MLKFIGATITVSLFAQSPVDSEYLYMKCGTNIGNASEIISACTSAIPDEFKEAFPDPSRICACLMYTLAKHFTANELEGFIRAYGANLILAIYNEGELEVISELQECFLASMNKDFDISEYFADYAEAFILGCVKEMENTPEFEYLGIDAYTYCNCVKDEFINRGFSLSDLNELEDENSVLFNEVLINCYNKYSYLRETTRSSNDVISAVQIGYIPIVDHGSMYRVKLTFGNLSKYFTLDSGASDILVSSSFERELLFEGLIGRENYLSEVYYSLADGSIVRSRRILIDNIIIGEFTVNNVIVGIIDGSEGVMLLLGKSFLDKFSKWSIDNQNLMLYLEK